MGQLNLERVASSVLIYEGKKGGRELGKEGMKAERKKEGRKKEERRIRKKEEKEKKRKKRKRIKTTIHF